MELYALDSVSGSSTMFQPTRIIENYESLIWAERYSTFGDFELITYDISRAIQYLPLESFVALRESTVPMVVESHKIEKPKNKPRRLVVTGRSFETVLERRASVNNLFASGSPPRAAWTILADKISDAAYRAMRIVIGDGARLGLSAVSPAVPGDEIPEIDLVFPTDWSAAATTAYEIKPGYLYDVVMEMLNANHHGLRAVRPPANSFDTTINIEIYNGANLTETTVFDARFDQIDSANYFFTHQGSANIAYIYGPNGASKRLKTAAPEPTGLARRVLLLDEMSDENLNTDEIRKSRGLVELYRNNSMALFDGETSYQIGERYNKPIEQGGYGLGDILLLKGEYGLSQNVRVVEFIRTHDASGYSAIPGFEGIFDE